MRVSTRIAPFFIVLAAASTFGITGTAVAGEGAETTGNATTDSVGPVDSNSEATVASGPQAPESSSTVVSAAAETSVPAKEPAPSAAERISRLESSLEADAKRLDELQGKLQAPDSEYAKAETAFRELDATRSAIKQQLMELEQASKQEALEQLKTEADDLESKWTLAKERFDLAIGERKAMQESVATLERKLEADRASLAKLKDSGEPQRLDAPTPGEQQLAQPVPQPPAEAPASAAAAPAAPVTTPVAATPPPQVAQSAPPQPAPLEAPATQAAAPTAPAATPPILTEKIAKELAVASEAAQKSHAAAKAAEDDAQTITKRIEFLQTDIGLQRQLRDLARKSADNSEKSLHGLNEELFRKLMAGENIDDVRQKIDEATARLRESRLKSQDIGTRLDELQSQLADLQSEKLAAATDLAQKREDAQRAQAVVEKLKNPFTLRNLLQWLIDHGPRIAAILGCLALFMWLSRVGESRLVDLTAKRGRRGSRDERENRAKTLLGIFRNVANIGIIAGGAMMILDEVGVPVAPIVGGAAVFGLAVAFGAQTLIRDYFVGFMVLLEQQYLVNDVIEIGPITGQVERVSLRITVLRDLEGRVHFVPHSQITTVTNLTHGWSRAVFEIGVAYKENVDDVIQVLSDLALELRRDEAFRFLILSDPVMLGVDSFGDSAVVIKFYIQTRPLHQWTVKREMLRRIKNEFDRLGIEIPFPHVTVYRGMQRAEHQIDDEQTTDNRSNRNAA